MGIYLKLFILEAVVCTLGKAAMWNWYTLCCEIKRNRVLVTGKDLYGFHRLCISHKPLIVFFSSLNKTATWYKLLNSNSNRLNWLLEHLACHPVLISNALTDPNTFRSWALELLARYGSARKTAKYPPLQNRRKLEGAGGLCGHKKRLPLGQLNTMRPPVEERPGSTRCLIPCFEVPFSVPLKPDNTPLKWRLPWKLTGKGCSWASSLCEKWRGPANAEVDRKAGPYRVNFRADHVSQTRF